MYYPYFRGKKHELYAILKANRNIFEKVMPVIEPVKLGIYAVKNLTKMCEENIPFILIINPTAQSAPTQTQILASLVNGVLATHGNYKLGFIVDDKSTRANILSFLNMPTALDKVFIHRGKYQGNRTDFTEFNQRVSQNLYANEKVDTEYIDETSVNSQKILIADGFTRRKRNADFPENSTFSNLSLTYQDRGYHGFGDYLMVGDYYKANERGGGGAFVMAIHMSYLNNDSVSMRHFLSDVTSDNPDDQAGKFSEAVQQLVDHYNANPELLRTTGALAYFHLHETEHFPGNGVNKEIAMIHHLEQIASLLN